MNYHQSAKYIFVDIYGYQDVCYYNKIDEIINKLNKKADKFFFQEKDKSINVLIDDQKIAIIIGFTSDDFIEINKYFNEKSKPDYKYKNEYKFDCQNEYKYKKIFYYRSDDEECDNCGGDSCREYCVNDNFDY